MPYKDKNKQKENWREYYRNHHDRGKSEVET